MGTSGRTAIGWPPRVRVARQPRVTSGPPAPRPQSRSTSRPALVLETRNVEARNCVRERRTPPAGNFPEMSGPSGFYDTQDRPRGLQRYSRSRPIPRPARRQDDSQKQPGDRIGVMSPLRCNTDSGKTKNHADFEDVDFPGSVGMREDSAHREAWWSDSGRRSDSTRHDVTWVRCEPAVWWGSCEHHAS